jgi:hypothetical protein
MKSTRTIHLLFWGMLTFYFLFLFYQILYSVYLLSDEAYFLWQQADHRTVFGFWNPQGRALTGLLQQWLFERSGTIANLRYVRLLSWGGWILCVLLLFYVLKRLQRAEGILLSDWTIYLATAFMASSLFADVYIGWAACAEVFIPVLLSLAAGLFLCEQVQKAGGSWRIPFLSGLLFTGLGVPGLFIYQTAYPFLLLPFYCLFLSRKDGRFIRPMRTGLLFFFFGLAVYYLLFRYSLHAMGMTMIARTQLKFNPLDRLSFFFSYPINQAFNYNFFFDTHSSWSQAVFPILFVAWIFFVFASCKREPVKNLLYLAGMVVWRILGYLPQLVAQEDFGGYRSMPVLSVMVFLMTADVLLPRVREGRGKQLLCLGLVLLMFVWGGYVYYAYRSHPLREEYRVVRQELQDHYNGNIKEVVVIQALEDGFARNFGVMHFKDEFGMPSLYKGWIAEPLVKQEVYEMTGSRREAQALKVTFFEKKGAMTDRALLHDPRVLLLDIQPLIDTKTMASPHP